MVRSPEEKHDFDNIYSGFHERIHRYLARLLGENEAEDVTQEVFVKVNSGLDGFRNQSNLSTWIYRIATNAATDHLRKIMAKRSEQVVGEPEGDMNAGAATPLSDNLLIRKEMNECIRSIVDSLPDNYRNVLILSELEELTNNQIAEVLGVSLGTVKVRLHRARARLKKELKCQCSFYRDERNELACNRKAFH